MDSLKELLLARDSQNPALLDAGDVASSYLDRLAALPLNELLSEPVNLASESAIVASSLTTLCHAEFHTFLDLRDTANGISDSLASIDSSIDALLLSIPQFEDTSRNFLTAARDIQVDRYDTSLALDQQEKLLDILELPQLIDACVRNNYYQEALDLSAHAERLRKTFSDIPLVNDIHFEVQQSMQLMMSQLFHSLRGSAKLPALLKAVNFLRRISGLDEEELALAFLSSRISHLEMQLESLIQDQEDDVKRIRRYIDVWREGTHDLITQFHTIFLEKDSGHHMEIASLLSVALHRLMDSLLTVLETYLPRVEESASVTSLLTQATYCATSFAHIGLDFRPLMGPVLMTALNSIISKMLQRPASQLETEVRDAKRSRKSLKEFLLAPGIQILESIQTGEIQLYAPPSGVATIPPLAAYLNSMIGVLNQLRLIAPAALLAPIMESMDTSLAAVARTIIAYLKETLPESGRDDSMEAFQIANYTVQMYLAVVLPFIRRSLIEGIFKEGNTSKHSSSIDVHEFKLDWEKWTSSHSSTRT